MKDLVDKECKRMLERGYSPTAIAMYLGYPVGTKEHYEIREKLGDNLRTECENCGSPLFGTGDCNCKDE